jgi:lipoprotein-anchoring transpeptidase ErfK/SrfK
MDARLGARHHAPMPRRLVLMAMITALASCAKGAVAPADTTSAPRSRPSPPANIEAAKLLASRETLVAVARHAVLGVHAAPGTERAYMSLDAANPWGQRLRLLVIGGGTDDHGRIWLRIQLPIWPNGQAGWVAASDVRVATTTDRLVVDLSERRLVRLSEGRAVARVPVAIGSAGTPTPPGRYFVWAKVDTERPSGPYGNFILGLSGFSDAIEPWAEWPGQPRLAIHGTDDPSDAGHAVSKGCVRVLNALLGRLTDLPLGTPVIIKP